MNAIYNTYWGFVVKDLTNRPLYLQLLRHLSGVSQSYALNIGPHNP